MELNATSSATSSTASGASNEDILRGLQLDDFLELMIAELQNQDPLNPLENTEILSQVSQIREIGATAKLNETLDAVLFGQSVTNAASLIGKEVRALNDEGDSVTGQVDKVTIAEGDVQVHVGEHTVGLNNVSEILA